MQRSVFEDSDTVHNNKIKKKNKAKNCLSILYC